MNYEKLASCIHTVPYFDICFVSLEFNMEVKLCSKEDNPIT